MQKVDCGSYNVFVNEDYKILNNFIDQYDPTKLFVIVDENTKTHCLPLLQQKIKHPIIVIEIASGEINKTIHTATALWEALVNYNADRNSMVLNLGGGVIGDMGGFVAATYMRGISFIQIPTTLLAQVDASVGGKLAIDFNAYKNLVGLFQDPNLVWVDTAFLKTLAPRELKSGYAEVIKHGLIQSPTLWNDIQNDALNHSEKEWHDIIFNSIIIKRDIVKEDPKEKDLRKILNFGHTIGHAVESFYLDTENQLTHGEAIAIGMICESYISLKKEMISKKTFDQIEKFINSIYSFDSKLKVAHPQVLDFMLNDKKNKSGNILFSLLQDIGTCTYNISIDKNLIVEALDYFEKTE